MPIDTEFPKNHQVIGKHKHSDGEHYHSDGKHYHFVWGPGRSDAETSSKPEVQEAYKARNEETTLVKIYAAQILLG
jgi:hypothetical protein